MANQWTLEDFTDRIDEVYYMVKAALSNPKKVSRGQLDIVTRYAGGFEDVMHECVTHMLKNLRNIEKPPNVRLSTFVYRHTVWCVHELSKKLNTQSREGFLSEAQLDTTIPTASRRSNLPTENLRHGELQQFISRRLLPRLSTARRQVIIRRFGLRGKSRQTLGEIAAEWGFSRQRVHQLEVSALNELSALLLHNKHLSQIAKDLGVSDIE